ncbi:MAG TPA: methyltransferase domain-containing protein [Acidimicrobiales bacterium]|nr:methyltransferase domain-containing protein [Acidimicrobiales bacterium]
MATVRGGPAFPAGAEVARAAMVAGLARVGIRDGRVLEAMARLPRERFVAGAHPLSAVYDLDRAIALGAGPAPTSSISAPRVVATMLELLELAPGMRVLEIGTGSGYHAALLAELVGRDGLVASVEIDPGLARAAASRLELLGYGAVQLREGDGYLGWPELAPFDRVVATVGCCDLAPAWVDQVGPAGSVLLPLQHGGWHPLTRIEPGGRCPVARVVARSGFVAIQGHQEATAPWRARPLEQLPAAAGPGVPLPAGLARLLAPEAGRERVGARARWDLDYYVALEDPRATSLLVLDDGASTAWVEPRGDRVCWRGPSGEALGDRLVAYARAWEALGCPPAAAYESEFHRRPAPAAPPGERGGERHWVVERLDHRQVVTYRAPAKGTGEGDPGPAPEEGGASP